MDLKPGTAKPNFFRSIIACFQLGFYRKVARLPLTSAFLHLAALAAILAAAGVLIRARDFKNASPHIKAFYNRTIPEDVFFENGKVKCFSKHSEKFLDREIGLIVDTSGETTEIPGKYAYVILVTDKKIIHGDSESSVEIPLPEERVMAREFISRAAQESVESELLAAAQTGTESAGDSTRTPSVKEFFEKGVPANLYFENKKAQYKYEASATVLEKEFGVIIDLSGRTKDIEKKYARALLFTRDKVFFGDYRKKETFRVPEERTNAREFFVESEQPLNLTVLVIFWASSFTSVFAVAAIIIGVISIPVYLLIGRNCSQLTFYGQLSICCFAVTPFFVGAIAIEGIGDRFFSIAVLAVSFLLFLLLATLGTRELLMTENRSSEVPEGGKGGDRGR